MEGTESATRERTPRTNGNQEEDHNVLISNKPLHRFVQKEPRSLGIVILMFGCAEFLMGFQLSGQDLQTSNAIYIPFWQGALFLVCGILSIYTELHPSKKMVTVCLAMYVVSIFGIVVSVIYRIFCLRSYSFRLYRWHYFRSGFSPGQAEQLLGVEAILLTSSFCVSVILIFLCVIARFALKSTHTQVIIQQIPPPRSETTSN